MKVFAITILLLVTAVLLACCGYFSGSNAADQNRANSGANTVSTENINPEANANTDPANSNTNLQNVPAKRPPLTPKPEALTRTGPDDSIITAENNAEGALVETRIFKNHDMLAKVERTLTASRREGSVRVFLKNGRVYELPVVKLKNVLNESPEEIIKAVGGEATATGSPVTGKTPGDTKGANTASTPQKQ